MSGWPTLIAKDFAFCDIGNGIQVRILMGYNWKEIHLWGRPYSRESTKNRTLKMVSDVISKQPLEWVKTYRKVRRRCNTSEEITCWKADAEKEVIVRVDGSHTRIGAVFLQEDKPAAYALWSLTSAQCSYVQIEKKMFATVAGCENFHQYN